MKKFTTILLLIVNLCIGCIMQATYSSASNHRPVFAQIYKQVTVGKSVRFSLKNVKKSYKIIYTSSNKKIASIRRKTGKCTGKKAGKVTIYAKVYSKNHRKITTLKQTLKVVKNTLLPNASFRLVQSINPYDYTVKIGCNRILLKKEVKKSIVTLTKKGSTSSLSASFSSLSSDGKEVTYTLTSQSQRKLCPKNGSMDGTYTLSSPLFSKKLSLSYHERIGDYSLSGYVFSLEGSPVNQAYVKCITEDSVKICYTDGTGFYRLKKVKNPQSLTVTKQGYLSETLTQLSTTANATRCENILLHPSGENNFSAQFHVTGQDGAAIPNASVFVLPAQTDSLDSTYENTVSLSEDDLLFSGETDGEGNILFYTNTTPNASPCTKWSVGEQESLSYQNSFTPDTAHMQKVSPLSPEETYTLLVGKLPQDDVPGYGFRKFTFCPKDYISQQFYFDVKLSDSHLLSLNNLSIKWDSNESNLCSNIYLSFYQRGNAKPVLNVNLSEDYFTAGNDTLSFSREIPYSLPDGSYYLRVQLRDKEQNCISACPMTTLYIVRGDCSSSELFCLPRSYARILAYGDFAQTNSTASFQRYQWVDGQYFYVDTLTTSPFQGKEWDVKTADLLLPYTEPETSYLLVPNTGNITAKDSLVYLAEEKDIFTGENTALASPPLAKINCVPASEISSPEIPPEISPEKISPSILSDATATKSFVRSCPSYPNSVTVFYKKEGTFLSASLSTSPSKNIGTVKNNTIMDIYTNGEPLFTTQESYQ